MTREEKSKIMEELTAKLSSTDFFYIMDASGMTVEATNKFRRACFEKGLEYRVVKNSLIKKALEKVGANYQPLVDEKVLKGFSGVIFSPESSKVPAQMLKEFHKKTNSVKPVLKGASISNDLFIGKDQIDVLIALKSKQELVGEVIGLLQSPARNVISALQSGGGKLAGLIKTLSEREQQ
jgi:large subunit ribosomal protein L10